MTWICTGKNCSNLEDLTQVLQSSVQEFVGLLQTLAALLWLGSGERGVGIRGAHSEPGQEWVIGRYLVGVIRYPLGCVSGLCNDLDQLHDLWDVQNVETLSRHNSSFQSDFTLWQLKHLLYLLLLWARCQTSVCTGSPGPPEHRRDSSPWTPYLSSPVAVTTGSCLLGSASGSRGAAGGGGRALAPETAARLVGDVWFSFSLYIEIDSSVKRQKYAVLFSPFWIISARFGWANTLATLNTISAFLAFTRSVLMVLFRNTWKSFVYMSRFSWTNDSLWKRNQTNNKYVIIICNTSSP